MNTGCSQSTMKNIINGWYIISRTNTFQMIQKIAQIINDLIGGMSLMKSLLNLFMFPNIINRCQFSTIKGQCIRIGGIGTSLQEGGNMFIEQLITNSIIVFRYFRCITTVV